MIKRREVLKYLGLSFLVLQIRLSFVLILLLLSFQTWAQGRLNYKLMADDRAKDKMYIEAIELYTKAIIEYENDYEAYEGRAEAEYHSSEYLAALKDINKAIMLDSTSPFVFHLRGRIKRELKNPEAAIDDFTKAILIHPYLAFYTSRGITYNELQDYKSAILDFKASLRLDPNSELDLCEIGKAFYYSNSYDSSLFFLTKAVVIDSSYTDAFLFRAHTYYSLGLYLQSIQDYSMVIKYWPNNFDAHFYRGCSNSKLKKYGIATQDFDKAVQIDPINYQAYFQRGSNKMGASARDAKRWHQGDTGWSATL